MINNKQLGGNNEAVRKAFSLVGRIAIHPYDRTQNN